MNPKWQRILACCLLALPAVALRADFKAAFEAYGHGNYEASRQEFLTLAALGDAASQYNLGAMALKGQGGPNDLGAAVGWFRAAADDGDRHLSPEKLDALSAQLSDAQHDAVAEIFKRYGKEGLSQTVLPVPAQMHCPDLTGARVLEVHGVHYPLRDRRHSQNGFVVLQLTIGADGIASDPQVLMAAPGDEFVGAAVEMWMSTRFQPAARAGQPIESRQMVKANYQITQGSGKLWDFGALKNLRELAIAGDTDAEYQIGLAASLDQSLGISAGQAHQQLVLAAQGGNPRAQYWAAKRFMALEECMPGKKQMLWLRAAAAAGDGPALLALALDALEGTPGEAQLAEATPHRLGSIAID